MIALLRRISGSQLLPTLSYITVIPLLIALPVFPANKKQDVSEMNAFSVYIVEFQEKPLATYQGSLAEYPATSPSQTGKKLDFKGSNVVRYQKYLDQKKSVYLDTIKKSLKRNPEIIQSYNVSFFGIAIKLRAEEVAAIRKLPGIKQIKPDEMRTLLNGPGPNK